MLIGIFFTLLAAFIGAAGFVTLKSGLESADFRLFILISVVVGIVLTGLILWSFGPGLAGLGFHAIYPFLITGSLGGGLLVRVAMTLSVQEIGASRAHSITSAAPLVTVAIGAVFFGNPFTWEMGIGTVLVVVGAAVLSYVSHQRTTEDSGEVEGNPLKGLGFALYAVLLLGIQPILVSIGIARGVVPLQGLFIRFATAGVLYGTYMLIARPDISYSLGRQTGLFLTAGAAWAISPLFKFYALTYIPPTVFSPLFRVGPLFTVFLGFVFLQDIEKVTWKTALGTVLVITGAVLVSLFAGG